MAQVWCQEYKGKLLRKAVQSEEMSAIVSLLDEGVHVDNSDDKQRTALHLASVKGNLNIVELLLKRGANANCKDANQNTPLMLACLSRKVPVITALLKYGANPKLCDSKGHDALTLAQNRLTHLQQCQVACDYLRGELVHIIQMIKEFVHQNETPTANDCRPGELSSDELQIEAMISRLSFEDTTSDDKAGITRQVADEFQELLQRFSTGVSVS